MRVRPKGLNGKVDEQGRGLACAGNGAALAELRLDYIAGMLRQLRLMSPANECPTLAGLLDLAHREAVLCRRARVAGVPNENPAG